MSHFLFEMWLNVTTRKQYQTEGKTKMLGITDKHFEAIAKHIESLDLESSTINVGDKVKWSNSWSANLKFVVIAVKFDTITIAWASAVSSKNATVTGLIKVDRNELTKLNSSMIVPARWIEAA